MASIRTAATSKTSGRPTRSDDTTVLDGGTKATPQTMAEYVLADLDRRTPAPVPTGRTGRSGRPVYDGRAWFASIDWSEVPPPRADDAGVQTDDSRTLTTEDEVLAWFAQPHDRA